MSKEAVLTKKMVFRQSPGLKIKVTGKTIKRISPTLKSIDKISKIFNEEQSKNNQNGLMTARSANFTASLAGTYYNCYAAGFWNLLQGQASVFTISRKMDFMNIC
jgi:ubiquitin